MVSFRQHWRNSQGDCSSRIRLREPIVGGISLGASLTRVSKHRMSHAVIGIYFDGFVKGLDRAVQIRQVIAQEKLLAAITITACQ